MNSLYSALTEAANSGRIRLSVSVHTTHKGFSEQIFQC